MKLDYEIVSSNKRVYIRLDNNGKPVTCARDARMRFDRTKARNILNMLPKPLKKFHFRMEAIPEIPPKTIQDTMYNPPDSVKQWVEKFGQCGDILNAAVARNDHLVNTLYALDNELLNLLHMVEIERPKDLFRAWIIYTDIRTNRRKRREAKDELQIINNVIARIDKSVLQRDRVQKAVDGLLTRKYTFRIIEEDDKDENL